jgi:hypothetical protein
MKAAIVGSPGSGKTTLLGTAQDDPRTFPMAFLNFEGGDQSLAGLDIDVFDIRDGKDYEEAYRDLKKPNAPWKSVGVDSITETQVAYLLEILDLDKARVDPDLLAQQDWGIVLTRMRRVVRQFVKMLPMHVFMTALSKDIVLPRVGSAKGPMLQGAFADEFPGIPDVVAYLAVEDITDEAGKPTGNTQRVLLLHDYPKFGVKVRKSLWDNAANVPSEIVEPTITKLLDALNFASGKK